MVNMPRASICGLGVVMVVASLQAVESPNASAPAARSEAQASAVAGSQTQALAPSTVASPRAVLDRYCVVCHNERLQTAGLMLDALNVEQVAEDAEVWEKVVGKLRSRSMPPARRPRPDQATYDAVASSLETSLDRAAAANPNPGRPALHRLNRTEYTNVIRDLLGLEIDGRSLLPLDESGFGFDNNADVLSVSPALLERYLLAARKVSRLAVGDPTQRPAMGMYRLPWVLDQSQRMSDDLPWGSRGGLAVRHHFPLDGEYVLRVTMQRGDASPVIRGTNNPEQLDIRLDDERIKLFSVGGECVGSSAPECIRPPRRRGSVSSGSLYDRTADEKLVVRFSANAGTRLVGVTFLQRTSAGAAEGAGPERLPASHAAYNRDRMSVESVVIEGPFNVTGPGDTPSRRQIFVCQPSSSQDDEACATRILSKLARRAYRRPVTDQDVDTLRGFYRAGQREAGFEAGIQWALEKILVSPDFLVRSERDPANVAPGVPYRISDIELASRLSFFLWSSIPDDELLGLAERGELSDPAVREQQVRRMLRDERASALTTNFGGQWLYLRNVRAVMPDPRAFPEFDDGLREAFQRETELFLETQLREDRSVLELLTANYTFLNERLAEFYEIPNVYGRHFRRVAYPDDRRAGLLGHGSVLTVTSYATRTSPVVRGKWLLENLLGAPPPPPPPDVPALEEQGGGDMPASLRERMEQHRQNPVCAACHAPMDPLGFALENFNGIGMWRTHDAGVSIDPTGVLPDGTAFDGPAGFRQALLHHSGEFLGTVTERLLTYALGRGVEYYDLPAVRQIMREAAPGGYRWSSLILGIVNSMPFQMRTAHEPESPVSEDVVASQMRR